MKTVCTKITKQIENFNLGIEHEATRFKNTSSLKWTNKLNNLHITIHRGI